MLNAKNQFIIDMKPETEAYLYNMAVNVSGFSPVCVDGILSYYNQAAEKAVKEMTLIACKKFPEAFCQYAVMRSCELFLLDTANDHIIITGNDLKDEGHAVLAVYSSVLKAIASDPKKPAGVHNETRLDFIRSELFKRMK